MKTKQKNILQKILIAAVLAFTIMIPQLFISTPAMAQVSTECYGGVGTILDSMDKCTIFPDKYPSTVHFKISALDCPNSCKVDVFSEVEDCDKGEFRIAGDEGTVYFECEANGNYIAVYERDNYSTGPNEVYVNWGQ